MSGSVFVCVVFVIVLRSYSSKLGLKARTVSSAAPVHERKHSRKQEEIKAGALFSTVAHGGFGGTK